MIAQTGLVAASGFLVYHWAHDPERPGRLTQVFDVVTDLAALTIPPLQTMYERSYENTPLWEARAVRAASERGLGEQVARAPWRWRQTAACWPARSRAIFRYRARCGHGLRWCGRS